ncbi:hypothetical protein ACFQ9Z_05970 [Streptomyces sp. NPDC056580]|uniref:hypothetical protein n=1 Tax=Streptomyces sp. NPDC056580 TaxID=3345872 RepID=UPI0036D089A9
MSPKRAGLNDAATPQHSDDHRRGKEVRIHFPVPSFRPPVGTGVVGAGTLSGVLIQGGIPADSPVIWPLVALVLGSMAYDVALRAVKRRDRGVRSR